MAFTIDVDIVSSEGSVFSGKANIVYASPTEGDVGILPHHIKFLSTLKAGTVRIVKGDKEECFFVNSGIIDVQPDMVTILADSAIRTSELDQAAAEEAKQRAEEAMDQAKSNTDIARAQIELAEAVAQIQALTKLRDRLHKTGMGR